MSRMDFDMVTLESLNRKPVQKKEVTPQNSWSRFAFNLIKEHKKISTVEIAQKMIEAGWKGKNASRTAHNCCYQASCIEGSRIYEEDENGNDSDIKSRINYFCWLED